MLFGSVGFFERIWLLRWYSEPLKRVQRLSVVSFNAFENSPEANRLFFGCFWRFRLRSLSLLVYKMNLASLVPSGSWAFFFALFSKISRANCRFKGLGIF
jgi:hypothetical protein